MQLFNTFTIVAGLFTVSQAYIIEMYEGLNCKGASQTRNVYDHTCAYVNGFQSFKITYYGGEWQQLTAYSQQACAGAATFQGCASGVNRIKFQHCYKAVNGAGGSNALSSYWSPGPCPI